MFFVSDLVDMFLCLWCPCINPVTSSIPPRCFCYPYVSPARPPFAPLRFSAVAVVYRRRMNRMVMRFVDF